MSKKQEGHNSCAVRLVPVYICHPYSKGSPEDNVAKVKSICEDIVNTQHETKKFTDINQIANFSSDVPTGLRFLEVEEEEGVVADSNVVYVPFAPHILFPEFMNEYSHGRYMAMAFCKLLLEKCREMWVFYDSKHGLTNGMQEEVEFASRRGIIIKLKSIHEPIRW